MLYFQYQNFKEINIYNKQCFPSPISDLKTIVLQEITCHAILRAIPGKQTFPTIVLLRTELSIMLIKKVV